MKVHCDVYTQTARFWNHFQFAIMIDEAMWCLHIHLVHAIEIIFTNRYNDSKSYSLGRPS
jgi:hypothetical protein